ncbi:MAG: hypothetical protein HY762_04785 [Planctomycetes bacterium]|nr:hypothetical protein [Planctomycetota bacterium]
MKDLFGQEINLNSKFTLFHDESNCEISGFLYHGFLFVNNKGGREILDKLKGIKKSHNRENREIHFNELNQHSKSPNGAKTNIALEWLDLAKEKLESDSIKFYLFGINKSNINDFWNNQKTFDENVYLEFFEIGLKSAIRWFNLDRITCTFLDNGKHDAERRRRICWLNNGFFTKKPSHEINTKNVRALSSDETVSKSEFSNFIQLVDILTGVARSSFVQMGESQKGQKECVDKFIDIVERFNNRKKAYNTKSKYWKKFCIQFFPTQNALTKQEFLDNDIQNVLKRGVAYCDRPTYKQCLAEEQNLKFSFK